METYRPLTNVYHLAITTSHVLGQLSDYSESVSKLRLPTAILAKHFIDAAGLKTTKQDGVPLFAPSREPKAALARLEDFCTGYEAASAGLDMCVRVGTTRNR